MSLSEIISQFVIYLLTRFEKKDMMKLKFLLIISLLFHITESPGQMKRKCDLIIHGGKIYTVDEQFSCKEAMAIKDDKILATASNKEILKDFTSDNVVDLSGKTVLPGFIDSHSHFYGYGIGLQRVDLSGTSSFDQVLSRMKDASKNAVGDWLVGRGWDQNKWEPPLFPDRKLLDELFPDRPVLLIRVDGHSVLANEEAIRRTGIAEKEGFLPGEKEINEGRLTGIFSENAADFLRSCIPDPDEKQVVLLLQKAEMNCFSAGLTGVTDAGLDLQVVRKLDSTQRTGSLRIRINAMLNPTNENISYFIEKGPYRTDQLNVRSIKMFTDGSLGSRTALLKSPYQDAPEKYGIQAVTPEKLKEVCSIAYQYGYQVCCHAIGDSAVHTVLLVYQAFLQGKNDLRWRIEHSQVVDPADISLYKTNSVIPSIQTNHATSDMYWARERLGNTRIHWAYAYKDLLSQNGWLANGTDFPIERIEPLLNFYAAVSRKDLKGLPEGGFQTGNSLSREEALRSMTIWAAKAMFEEKFKGSLEPGKLADFIILDKDIMTVSEYEIPKTKIISTYMGGKQVY